MNQKPIHTEPILNSKPTAYGYKHADSLARYGVSWRYTVSEPGYKAYSSSVGRVLYVESTKTDYTFPRKEDNVSTVPIRRLKPLSIYVINNPSGSKDSNVIYMNNPDTSYKMNEKGEIYDTLIRKKSGGEFK